MKTRFTLLSIAIAFSFFANSQTGKVSGTVTDASSKAIHSATVSLLRAKDSSLVKFSPTDKNGAYEFENIKDGKYFISASNVGYGKVLSPTFEVSSSGATVPTLIMKEQAKGMAEVTVTAKKPFIETRIDKTIVNVESAPTTAGATALEVLEKSPGVTVDNDGNISLRGKGRRNYYDRWEAHLLIISRSCQYA